jgi:hypothetical protein
MSQTIEEANEALRTAVADRLRNTPADDPKMVGYVREDEDQAVDETYAEWRPAFQEEFPAERLLLEALKVVRDRRPKYGGPLQHFRRTVGMINAAFADVLKRPLTESDWAIFMTLDKVARYCGPNKTADGPVDLAGYAACLAEVESAQ